jgi:hypothetical protein
MCLSRYFEFYCGTKTNIRYLEKFACRRCVDLLNYNCVGPSVSSSTLAEACLEKKNTKAKLAYLCRKREEV